MSCVGFCTSDQPIRLVAPPPQRSSITMTDTSSTATSSTPLLTSASTTTTTNPHTYRSHSSAYQHLFSRENPIPLWYRLYLCVLEPMTSLIAMYQLIFHPRVYLSETTPGALIGPGGCGYNSQWDTIFNQLALCMMFTIYIEVWLFGFKWAHRPDQWNSAIVVLLVGDVWFNVALVQGNQWTPWWKWTQFEGASKVGLVGTAVMGLLAPITRVAFLAKVGFQTRQQRNA